MSEVKNTIARIVVAAGRSALWIDSIARQTTDSPLVVENIFGGGVVKNSNASPILSFHHPFAHSKMSTAADMVVANIVTPLFVVLH